MQKKKHIKKILRRSFTYVMVVFKFNTFNNFSFKEEVVETS